jgi:hypothetical protein
MSGRIGVAQSGLIASHHELGIADVLLTFAELVQLTTKCSLSNNTVEKHLKEPLFLVAIARRRCWVFVEFAQVFIAVFLVVVVVVVVIVVVDERLNRVSWDLAVPSC